MFADQEITTILNEGYSFQEAMSVGPYIDRNLLTYRAYNHVGMDARIYYVKDTEVIREVIPCRAREADVMAAYKDLDYL